MKPAYRVLDRNIVALPRGLRFGARDANEREAHAVGIGEGQNRLTETLLDRLVRHAFFDEAVCPIADGAFRYAEHGLLREADTVAAPRSMRPREERQDRTGMADLVAEIQMVGAGIVVVDRLLDEPKAKNARVEIEIAGRITRNRGHMMNARHD